MHFILKRDSENEMPQAAPVDLKMAEIMMLAGA